MGVAAFSVGRVDRFTIADLEVSREPTCSFGVDAGQMNRNSDVRPFYGHSQSELYQRPLRENSEVRPFYGHSLPDEVDEPGQGHRDNDPYYGNAISSGGD